MATLTETLDARLRLDMTHFNRGMMDAKKSVNTGTSQMEGRFGSLARSVGKAVTAMGGLAVAGIAARHIFNVNRETQAYMASLKTVTGSAENATQAFQGIKDFASSTPFQVSEITEAFIRLKGLGLDPSSEALRSYGDTASAMGLSLLQVAEAVSDSITGEFERLKAMGIRAKSEGDNVTFTFQGVSKTVKKNAEEIEGYLQELGRTKFGGAMSEQMETINGALSNTKDNIDEIARIIGEGGLNTQIENAIKLMRDWTGELSRNPEKVAAIIDGGVTLARVLGEMWVATKAITLGLAAYRSAAALAAVATVGFGTAVRTLMSSTGIGALGVAVGLLAEFLIPWEEWLGTADEVDDLTDSVTEFQNAIKEGTKEERLAALGRQIDLLVDRRDAFTAFAKEGRASADSVKKINDQIDVLLGKMLSIRFEKPQLELPEAIEGSPLGPMAQELSNVNDSWERGANLARGLLDTVTLQHENIERQRAASDEIKANFAATNSESSNTSTNLNLGATAMKAMKIAGDGLQTALAAAKKDSAQIARDITRSFLNFGLNKVLPGSGDIAGGFFDLIFSRHGTFLISG